MFDADISRPRRAGGVAGRIAGRAVLVLAMAGCATSPLNDQAGVRVVGDGGTVRFGWDADHPWAAQFQTPARFHLFAQYRSQGQLVEQDLGVARSGPGGGWVFMLPATLRATPESAVCLLLGASRQSAAIPVRLRPAPGADSARFRYAAWERQVAAETGAQLSQREMAALQAQLDDVSGAHGRLRAELQRSGTLTADDCRRVTGRAAAPAEAMPSDTVAPNQQNDVAQRICVRRARNMRRIVPEYRVDVAEFVGKYLQDGGGAQADRLRPLGAQFQQHWSRWIDRTGIDYTPEIGDAGDILPIVGTAAEALKRWNGGGGDAAVRRSVAAGLLDAYGGCLEDVRKQLAVKYDAWQRAQANKPMRDRLFAERQLAVCQGRIAELNDLQAAVLEAQGRLDARRAAQPPSSGGAGLPSGASAVLLNGQACSL